MYTEWTEFERRVRAPSKKNKKNDNQNILIIWNFVNFILTVIWKMINSLVLLPGKMDGGMKMNNPSIHFIFTGFDGKSHFETYKIEMYTNFCL